MCIVFNSQYVKFPPLIFGKSKLRTINLLKNNSREQKLGHLWTFQLIPGFTGFQDDFFQMPPEAVKVDFGNPASIN